MSSPGMHGMQPDVFSNALFLSIRSVISIITNELYHNQRLRDTCRAAKDTIQ